MLKLTKLSLFIFIAAHIQLTANLSPSEFFNQFSQSEHLLIYPFNPSLDEKMQREDYFPEIAVTVNKKEEARILQKIDQLQQRLGLVIFGQNKAVKETSEAVLRFAAGINDPNTPIASLLYCGPSGVGKTELAKQLCLELYGDLNHMLRIDMSEFSESHTISRLIGSPPGYVGYGEGGMLTNFITKNPYSVILIDEAEKAHPKVLKIFLHVFDNGYITSATGKAVDCRKCVFILTSNLAAMEIAEMSNKGLNESQILEFLKPAFMNVLSPELFNRMDTVVFLPLSSDVMQKLVNKLLFELRDRVFVAKKINLIFDDTLINYFVNFGLDPKLGARPLKRLVDKELGTVVARAVIEGKFNKDAKMKCFYHEGAIVVQKLQS